MPIPQKPHPNAIPFPVRKRAYQFDGTGNLKAKRWNISEGVGSVFNWYHIEVPGKNQERSIVAESLIPLLYPPLTLHEILALVKDGPFCGNINGALIFRINLSGPGLSDVTLRIAARVTDNCIITVSWGRVPRLGFESLSTKGLLSAIPIVEHEEADAGNNEMAKAGDDEEAETLNDIEAGNHEYAVVDLSLLAVLTSTNDAEKPEQLVPNRIAGLLVHVVDAHVNHIQLAVSKLETELDSLELLLVTGDSMLEKEILDDRKCLKMHLNLQRLIQIVEYGKQVFSAVREECATKIWFTSEDAVAFGELIGRLRRLKERLRFLVSRVTAAEADLDCWEAKQRDRKLYCIFFCSMVSFALSFVGGIFRINIGGLPWTGQGDEYGFLNVILLYVAILSVLLVCSAILSAWKRRRALTRR